MKQLFRPISFAALCLPLVMWGGTSSAEITGSHALSYEIYAGGFQALKGDLNFDKKSGKYDIQMDVVTQNFIGKLFPWSGHYESTGSVSSGNLSPTLHQSKSIWKSSTKIMKMEYSGGKLVKSTTEQNGATTVADSFTSEMTSGTVDMLTATLMMLNAVDAHDACKGSFPVFDGKRRFNITLNDGGTATINKSKYSIFEGEAMRCTLKVEPVAGFKKKDMKRGWMAVQAHTEAHAKPPTIWFARLEPNGPMLPVRMEINSDYGAVIAHLKSAKE